MVGLVEDHAATPAQRQDGGPDLTQGDPNARGHVELVGQGGVAHRCGKVGERKLEEHLKDDVAPA